MTADAEVRALLVATTPDRLDTPDTVALQHAGARRRWAKRSGAVGGGLALVAVLGLAGWSLPSRGGPPGVGVAGDPTPAASASVAPTSTPDPMETEDPTVGWDNLTAAEAIAGLREALSTSSWSVDITTPDNADLVFRVVTLASPGVPGGGRRLDVVDTATHYDGASVVQFVQSDATLTTGASLAAAQAVVRSLPAPAQSDYRPASEASGSTQDTQQAMGEAEALATGQPTRKAQVAAFARLADALQPNPRDPGRQPGGTLGDPHLLTRAYDVLAALDPDTLEFRGVITGLNGLRMVAFAVVDQTSGDETVLLFGAGTGWYFGEITYGDVDGARTLTGAQQTDVSASWPPRP